MERSVALKGAGLADIRFGMTQDEIEAILGDPEDKSSYDDVMELYFQNFINVSFRDNATFQIGATRRSKGITYNGMDIFEEDPRPILRAFEAKSGEAFEMSGFIIFPSLGVSLTGFHDDDMDGKAMTVSLPEEWEPVAHEFTPISFL